MPQILNDTERHALQYVRNTAGSATKAHFVEDYDPVGEEFWRKIHVLGYATENSEGKIVLTEAGAKALDGID